MNDNEDSLSVDKLAIREQVLIEKALRQRRELKMIKLKLRARNKPEFEENGKLSQFRYNTETKKALGSVVSQLLAMESGEKSEFNIALLSCPSLYSTIKKIHENAKIFEFDKRFSVHGADFVFYDFNKADNEKYLQHLWNKFDIIIADPPLLAEECIKKISNIIKNLRANGKIIFCSGKIPEVWLCPHFPVTKCNFRPERKRNLGKEFVSYANFNLDDMILKNE